MEQGKSVADSWKAVFVESSAKENKVDSLKGKVDSVNALFFFYFFLYDYHCFILLMTTEIRNYI